MTKTIKTDYAPGSLGCHEALHMASYLADAVDTELTVHPAITANPQWLALAQSAQKLLAALYQAIGDAHLPDVDETPEKVPPFVTPRTAEEFIAEWLREHNRKHDEARRKYGVEMVMASCDTPSQKDEGEPVEPKDSPRYVVRGNSEGKIVYAATGDLNAPDGAVLLWSVDHRDASRLTLAEARAVVGAQYERNDTDKGLPVWNMSVVRV